MKIKQIIEADNVSQLGQIQQSMKKAKILAMTPGANGQPATYKVSLDGSADPAQVNNPNAAGITTVSADKITKDAAGNIVINMNNPNQQQGPDTTLIGKDAQVKEQPNEDQLQVSNEKWPDMEPGPKNTYPIEMVSGKPMALVGVNKVKIEPASGPFTPELLAKSVYTGGNNPGGGGFDKCYVRMINSVYRALSRYDVIKLDPKDYAKVTSYQQLPYKIDPNNPKPQGQFQHLPGTLDAPKGQFKALEDIKKLSGL